MAAGWWFAAGVAFPAGALAALAAWCAPVWRGAGWRGAAAVAALFFGAAAFLLGRPHEEQYAGLDSSGYRLMAQAFAEGRALQGPDRVLEGVPAGLRTNFMYRPMPAGGTRDLAFMFVRDAKSQVRNWRGKTTVPWFQPLLPMGAAGLAKAGGRAEWFVPLLGALAWWLVLGAAWKNGRGWGLFAAVCCAAATAWPAWFLRGFHAEAAGAALVAGVVAADAARRLRGWGLFAAGVALGFSVGLHRSAGLLGAAAGLVLAGARGRWRDTAALAAGAAAGLAPVAAAVAWVCRPYGRFMGGATMALHWSMAVAIPLALAGVVCGVAALHAGRVRRWLAGEAARRWLSAGAAAVAAGAWAVAPAAGGLWRAGWVETWSGIGWGAAAVAAAGGCCVFLRGRPMGVRVMLALVCALAPVASYVQGWEQTAGLWSFRRFAPTALVLVALLAPALGDGLARLRRRLAAGGRPGAPGFAAVVAVLAACAAANAARWPAAYGAVNGRGATAWAAETASRLEGADWAVFDYFPHSVPLAAGLERRVLGVGEWAKGAWPDIAAWLGKVAATQEVALVSSWSLPSLEEGVRLVPAGEMEGELGTVKGRRFFPAEAGTRPIRHSFSRVEPLAAGETGVQAKVLDGGYAGLRGPWGAVRCGGQWTRQGAGIVGPVPGVAGETVRVRLEGCWTPPSADWPRQTLAVTAPWGERREVSFGETPEVAEAVFREAPGGGGGTGIWTFTAERPYDPAAFGMRGYDADLGALLRRVEIGP